MKHYSKTLTLLFLVAGLVIVGWIWYAGRSDASPQNGAGANASTSAGAPYVVLGTPTSSSAGDGTALMSSDPANGDANSDTPYYGEEDTTASVFTRVATTSVPDQGLEAMLVRDITNNVDIADLNQNVRWPTASLTKLMTATIVMDHLNMSTEITITPQMMAVDPTESHLVVNGTYTVYDLLHVMLMPSSNVAAEALADYYGRTQFLAEMNGRAAEWGMDDTNFDDPSGLSSANESTAHDLAILATHVYQNYPTILQFTDTPQIVITNLATGAKINVASINQFAGEPDFIGGKTGYIPESRDNLISLFRYDGKPVLVVVLGTADTSERFTDTTKLLDWFIMDYKGK
jgi:D-alanyl-D-alanine endopeptidase (penicillin-binding protein 7)